MGAGRELFSGRESGIIIAADVSSLPHLRDLAEVASRVPELVAIKVGFSLVLRHGLPAAVNTIREVTHLPVIYDHQKAGTDIPQMGKSFAMACRDADVQGMIIFPQAGPKTLEGFVEAAFDHEVVPIVGLVMTHPAYLQSEGGYLRDDAPELICKTALGLGVTDFVLPGTKPEVVRRFAQSSLGGIKGLSIMMPGIGAQGGSIKSAFEAAAPHRPFAIAGRAVYEAPDPKAALASLAAELGLIRGPDWKWTP
jgi:orotidine-5'-phosphate decarboxylase